MNEQLKIIISAETAKFKQGIEDAQKKIKSFKDQVKEASKNVDDNLSSIGTAMANGAKTIGTTIAATGAALLALGASTAEYRNEQAKLKTAFEDAGGSAAQATETYNDLYRVLGDGGQATEAANHLAKLTTEEKALNEWTTICQGAYATFGSSLPIESMTEAANETAKTGSLTGALADALNWAGVSEDAFQASLDACNTEAEREALIRSTLIGLYGEAAATYEENNAQVLKQNEANAKLQSTLATLGEAMAPVVTAFTNFANEALAIVVPYIQQLSDQYMPSLQSVLSKVADALGIAFGFIKDNWEILLGMGAVITGIATAIGLYNAVAAVKAAMDALQVTTLGALIAAYAAQAAAMLVAIAPYALIVAAIAAVIAIIVVCVKHWDEIKAKVIEVAKSMKQKIDEAVAAIKNKFNEMKSAISAKVSEVATNISNKFQEIKNGISEKIQSAVNAVKEKFNSMKSSAVSVVSDLVSNVTSKFESIRTGIANKINAARDAVKSAIEKIKSFFKFEWSLPKLKLPHFGISGKFSLDPPSIPKITVDWYANGGVFDSPTLFPYGGRMGGLGEAGAEAIVPLEKNTQWLDRIAERLSDKQGNTPIILEVDGKRFAQITVDSINQLTRQTGSLPLKFA